MRVGILVCEWNNHITDRLLQGAMEELTALGVPQSAVTVKRVPGSFELIYASALLSREGLVDAVIAIGCVIRGDTPHFDYICQGTTQGLAQLNAEGGKPIINGLLTVNNEEQALERAGGALGNKGREYALTAVKMIDLAWQFQK